MIEMGLSWRLWGQGRGARCGQILMNTLLRIGTAIWHMSAMPHVVLVALREVDITLTTPHARSQADAV